MSGESTKKIPIITVGRYAGTQIDKLPNSYLRWMIGQDFPKAWLDIAREKLSKSDFNDIHLNLSRHSIDMYSKRFLHQWLKEVREKGERADGLATFMAKHADRAFKEGKDVSKHRHQDDGIVKELDEIHFVFNVNPDFPDYKDLITVM